MKRTLKQVFTPAARIVAAPTLAYTDLFDGWQGDPDTKVFAAAAVTLLAPLALLAYPFVWLLDHRR